MNAIKQAAPQWTDLHRKAAQQQGWDIFQIDTEPGDERSTQEVNGKPYGCRPFELQAITDMDVLVDDEKAHAHVYSLYQIGDALAQSAIAFLAKESPLEHAAIFEVTP